VGNGKGDRGCLFKVLVSEKKNFFPKKKKTKKKKKILK